MQVAGAVAAEKLRLNIFGPAYVAVGAGFIVVLFYLGIAAQITQASYQIAQLQDQQSQLIAEQDQLRYQEVSLHAPAQVQAQAAQAGMQRVVPSNYVQANEVAVDLTAPIGAAESDQTPLWMRAVAFVVSTAGGAKDVQAASKP